MGLVVARASAKPAFKTAASSVEKLGSATTISVTDCGGVAGSSSLHDTANTDRAVKAITDKRIKENFFILLGFSLYNNSSYLLFVLQLCFLLNC